MVLLHVNREAVVQQDHLVVLESDGYGVRE
jgi:hypothetical protein